MKSDINDLCEAFLAALTNAGYAVKSIENYKQVKMSFPCFLISCAIWDTPRLKRRITMCT